jgi:uncharacterized protein YbaP (TraB family)
VIARLLLALALAAMVAACGGPAEDWPAPSPALWEISGPDGEAGWLFGTIHSLPKGVEWRTPAVEAALERADVLVVEVANLADGKSGSRAFAAVSTSPGLPPLLQRVAPADRPALSEALKRAGMKEVDFGTTESWAAALVIANLTGSGDSANGVDRALLRQGLPVIGLEGFEEQFAIFDRLAQADQAELLRLTARDAGRDRRTAPEAWLTGDLDTLEHEELAGLLADPELREALLAGRNRAWVDRITGLLEEGRRPLVAVGVGHMIGEDGLPALLAAKGYTAKRIQ